MIKNYVTTLFRNFRRQKVYTFLNVCGLALGLAVFIIIVRYIQYEFSYDNYHENADRIYQIAKIKQRGGSFMGSNRYAVTPAPLAAALREEFPEVESATKFYTWIDTLIRSEQKTFMEDGWVFVDNHMFEIFTFSLIRGDEKTALIDPYTVVISEKMGEKYIHQHAQGIARNEISAHALFATHHRKIGRSIRQGSEHANREAKFPCSYRMSPAPRRLGPLRQPESLFQIMERNCHSEQPTEKNE